MHFIGPFRVLGNLLRMRSPLFETSELKALPKQAVYLARNAAMVLHDPRCNPVGHATILKKISIERHLLSLCSLCSRLDALCPNRQMSTPVRCFSRSSALLPARVLRVMPCRIGYTVPTKLHGSVQDHPLWEFVLSTSNAMYR